MRKGKGVLAVCASPQSGALAGLHPVCVTVHVVSCLMLFLNGRLILFPTVPWCSYCGVLVVKSCFKGGIGQQCFQSVQSGTLDLLNPVDSSDDQRKCD